MMLTRRSVTIGSAALATSALVLGPEAVAAPRHRLRRTSAESGQAVLDWERICFRTVYPATPIPIGAPILGFVSLTMLRAAERSAHLGASSESAAVARAAHDVLARYVPAATTLDADLQATYDAIGPGHARTKGDRIGADAARDLFESRVGDGWMDGSIHYTKTAGPGVWWLNAGTTDMVGPWLGSLRPLLIAAEPQSGPYSLSSTAWATDYNEVKRVGSSTSTLADRSADQTATALFYNGSNAAMAFGDAVARYLDAHPLGILETARLFAMMHVALTDTIINVWRHKRDVGFWRPFQAISGLYDDGNAATAPQPGWAPLVPNPNYSDYLSGHGAGTSPQAEVVRRVLGEATPLEMRSTLGSRTYARISDIEFETLHARIWGGLHYRKAMNDTYDLGHRNGALVVGALG
jgi:hypothetical protein